MMENLKKNNNNQLTISVSRYRDSLQKVRIESLYIGCYNNAERRYMTHLKRRVV